MSRSLKYTLAAVAAAIVPGLAAPAAMANDAANCQYTGTAVTNPGVQWVGPTSGIPPVVQPGGTYNFTSFTFTCAGGDTNGTETGVAQMNLSSSGSFTNTVCGTGVAQGTAAVTSASALAGSPDLADLTSTTTSYSIQFAGGQGVLQGSGSNDDGALTIKGSTSIAATGGGSTPNTTYCTQNFEVAGDAVISGGA